MQENPSSAGEVTSCLSWTCHQFVSPSSIRITSDVCPSVKFMSESHIFLYSGYFTFYSYSFLTGSSLKVVSDAVSAEEVCRKTRCASFCSWNQLCLNYGEKECLRPPWFWLYQINQDFGRTLCCFFLANRLACEYSVTFLCYNLKVQKSSGCLRIIRDPVSAADVQNAGASEH